MELPDEDQMAITVMGSINNFCLHNPIISDSAMGTMYGMFNEELYWVVGQSQYLQDEMHHLFNAMWRHRDSGTLVMHGYKPPMLGIWWAHALHTPLNSVAGDQIFDEQGGFLIACVFERTLTPYNLLYPINPELEHQWSEVTDGSEIARMMQQGITGPTPAPEEAQQ